MYKFYSLLIILAVFSPLATAQETVKKPNVILIMADDLGYEALSTYGSADYKTPVLDELAATGMKFNHCYSQPLCTPSRVQIMTGRYNHRNYKNFGVLPKTETTFGHLMQKAGYSTAVAGKWQLYGADTKHAQVKGHGFRPEEAGFDDYCLWQVDKLKADGERYADPLIDRKGKGPVSMKGAYGPEVFTDFILEFIEEKKDSPFFVYYPMVLTHDPFVPTPDSPEWSGNRNKTHNKHFADMVAYMDKCVGRITEKLDELGLREDTLFIFTGDNGTDRDITSTMTDGRIIKGNKGYPDDGGTHVPLIAHWPGVIEKGQLSDHLIDFSDFLPTIVELGGGTLPSDRELDGRSFLNLLKGQAYTPREWVFCHYNPRWGRFLETRFARDQRYKLYGDGRFYDVENDVLESKPLAKATLDTDTMKVYQKLQGVLDEML